MLNTLPIINFDQKKQKQKTAGNQTLFNTLKGYSENGYKVTMITFYDVPKVSTPFPNVVIRRSVFFKPINYLMRLKKKCIDFLTKIIGPKKAINLYPTEEINRDGKSRFMMYWGICAYLEGFWYSRFIKPDLIYGYEIYSTKPAKKLSKRINVPCVSRFQGTELGFFLDNNERFFKAHSFVEGTKVDTDLIIMANDGTDGERVLEKLNVDLNKIKFWVNGLHDKQKYLEYSKDLNYKKVMDLPEDAFVICTANRFVDWKRIDRIIKVMAKICEKNKKVFLIAVGDGPEMNALTSLVEKLNLKNIIFTGALEHEDTIYHIGNADMYITLNHSGNLGNSILEALALGIPVCTLKNDSVEKVLKNNYNAILFEDLNEVKITSSILELVNNAKKREELSKNAKSYANYNLLSWAERMVLETKEIEKLINRNIK